mmetsp:Transcript_32727/g.60341  ORF Transcript_32727/g.60341 Transcript_32727/m.60341 type:complete len:237 (+) Transcript_32727:101-811(+)
MRTRTKLGSPSSTNSSNTDEESLLRRRADSKPRNKSLFKVLFHKICLLSGGDKQGRREGFIGLLQDIVGGIVLGTIGMSILLLLDFSNILNLETARVFRKTASHIFSDPAIIESIEEEIEKKLLSMDVYNAMKKELADSQAVIEKERKIVEARVAKATSLKAELDPVKKEYAKLMEESGLDWFCPECQWGMGLSCKNRVEFLLDKYPYEATAIEAMAKLVKEGKSKQGKCLNKFSR